MNHLGIDPGSRNLGIAVTDDDGKLIYSNVLDMQELGGMVEIVTGIQDIITKYGTKTLGIERFVVYKGIHSAASEDILMLTGAVVFMCSLSKHEMAMYRAISWKPALCKHLVKTKGFSNPSTSFDKKYSRAAAASITGQEIKSDHIADAVALSYMWKVHGPDTKNKRS